MNLKHSQLILMINLKVGKCGREESGWIMEMEYLNVIKPVFWEKQKVGIHLKLILLVIQS